MTSYPRHHQHHFSLNPHTAISGGGSHSDRPPADSYSEAIVIFNSIKETYSKKIEELNELKRQVFLIGHHSTATPGEGYILDH
jgi:hypothetical protein